MNTYSGALDMAQRGHFMTRMKWVVAGKSIIVFIHKWDKVTVDAPTTELMQQLGVAAIAPSFACTTADGRLHFGWLPTHCDQLADDWVSLGGVPSAVGPCMQRYLARYWANKHS